MIWRPRMAVLLCGALAFVACSDPPQLKPDKSADAGASSGQPVENSHIAEALASAAKGTGPNATEGPPQSGVFAPGGADKAQPLGKMQVTVVDKGSDPKIQLTPLIALDKPAPLDVTVLRVEQTSGGRTMAAVGFALTAVTPSATAPLPAPAPGDDGAEPEKKAPEKGKGEPKEEESDAPTAEPLREARPIVFTIIGVRRQKDIPLSDDEMKKLETLKGTTITAKINVDGSLSSETFELPKEADLSVADTVRILAETIGLFFSPLPAEPVGQGAYWIASDRGVLSGMDVVRYRVTKVEKLQGDEAILSLDLRMYAAGAGELPPGAPDGAINHAFQGSGKAEFARKRGHLLPVSTQALEIQVAMQIAASADAQVASVYKNTTAGVLQPPQPPDADGEDAKDTKPAPKPKPR